MAQFSGLFGRHATGNHDITQITRVSRKAAAGLVAGKRQHVGGVVPTPKLAVEGLDGRVRQDCDGDRTAGGGWSDTRQPETKSLDARACAAAGNDTDFDAQTSPPLPVNDSYALTIC